MKRQDLFEVAGLSRQAFQRWGQRRGVQQQCTPQDQVLNMALEVRQNYLPGGSARQVYFFIRKKLPTFDSQLLGWGKHRFEAFCLENGLRVEHRRFIPKTTIRGDFVFPNRIEGMEVSNINQVWVSDITYLFASHGQLIGYATTLIDVYSRHLLGLNFSQTMRAEETSLEVLRQAFQTRQKNDFNGLLFHSDGGKQYIQTEFIRALRNRNIQSSMAENCYQNAFAEAFNDTLKNHLLHEININSFPQLKKQQAFLQHCYNYNKPHTSLNQMNPIEYELNFLSLQPCQRTSVVIKKIEYKK